MSKYLECCVVIAQFILVCMVCVPLCAILLILSPLILIASILSYEKGKAFWLFNRPTYGWDS